MTLYNDPLPTIPMHKLKEFLASRGQNQFHENQLQEACDSIKTVATPQGTFKQVFYDADSHHLLGDHSFEMQSKKLLSLLAHTTMLLAGVITLGNALQNMIDERFLAKDFQQGIALDATATFALQLYLEQFAKTIDEMVHDKHLSIAWCFIPGNGDWPMRQQLDLALAAGGKELGIATTPGGLLLPRKSLAVLFCLRSTENCSTSSCSHCALSNTCNN